MAAKKTAVERWVVICTDRRGVFFGRLAKLEDVKGPQLRRATLEQARNCVYWTRAEKGVLGLASAGPSSGCRIGPAVPTIELDLVTAVIDCSPEAVTAWNGAPWQA